MLFTFSVCITNVHIIPSTCSTVHYISRFYYGTYLIQVAISQTRALEIFHIRSILHAQRISSDSLAWFLLPKFACHKWVRCISTLHCVFLQWIQPTLGCRLILLQVMYCGVVLCSILCGSEQIYIWVWPTGVRYMHALFGVLAAEWQHRSRLVAQAGRVLQE